MAYRTNLNLRATDIALCIFRIWVSILMLMHGFPKLMLFFGAEEILFADPIGMGIMASLALAVFAEVICSVLIILGLATRLAAIPLIVAMCVAIFVVHVPDGWGRQELPSLYLAGYVLLLLTGPGKFSLDQVFMKKKKRHF